MIDNAVLNFLKERKFKQSKKSPNKECQSFNKEYQISGNQMQLTLCFPDQFPYKLPSVYIPSSEHSLLLPHVEKDGKICLFQDGTTVIDFSRPVDIVETVLKKAIEILELGFSDDRKIELISEFDAYWRGSDHKGNAISLVTSNNIPRELFAASYEKKVPLERSVIIAENKNELVVFLKKYGATNYKEEKHTYYCPLLNAIEPPRYKEEITVGKIISIIKNHSSNESHEDFIKFLKSSKLPIYIVFSIPFKDYYVLYAVGIPHSNDRKKVNKGFRANKVNAKHEINFVIDEFIERISLNRFDADYLLKRSGATNMLNNKEILIIGIGSVGGFLADYLRASGIGKINVLDRETLTNENLHRHNLGMKFLNQNKAEAIKVFLDEKYTIGEVFAHNINAFSEIKGQFNGVDLVIDVSGDENLYRKNNSNFPSNIPLLFGWVEALGLGHHIVSSNIGSKKGCLECLYTSDEGMFVANQAMFSMPNQNLRRVHAGCSGYFLPHTNIDAINLAIDLSRCAIDILADRKKENFLRSSFGTRDIFLSEGFEFSKRAKLFKDEEIKNVTDFVALNCSKCGKME